VELAPFPRTSRSLAADRSFRVVFLAVLGATALGAWAVWAAWGHVELARVTGRPALTPVAPGAATTRPVRASFPPAVRHELETVSLARWLLGSPSPDPSERGPSP
jgi:hypothetical protein